MNDNDTKRLSRLTAILTQLQTKRLLTASELANKFFVSIRTIYRDIKALEQAGVPILTKDGKGYTLMEGYRIPPIMFTESQANALILAEQIVLKNKDASFIKDYTEAIDKIKAVLRHSMKDKVNLLTERTRFDQNINRDRNSNNLSDFQFALINFCLTRIEYTNITQKADFENRYAVEDLKTDEIFQGLINRSNILANEIKSFSELELMEKIKVVSPWFEANQPRYEYLQHVANHATYHRGQIVTIGRNVGIADAPMTDYNFFNIMNEHK
jgi:biotin operon repressor